MFLSSNTFALRDTKMSARDGHHVILAADGLSERFSQKKISEVIVLLVKR